MSRPAAYLERCLQLARIANDEFCETMIAEASVFHAWFRRDAQRAIAWFASVRNPRKLPPIIRIRANVVLKWAQNRRDEADASWEEGLAWIKGLPNTPLRSSLEQSWLEWRQEINERRLTS